MRREQQRRVDLDKITRVKKAAQLAKQCVA
jgi:hypothetical protein